MHDSVMSFAQRTLTSEHIAGKRVLEVGSYDVNGSVRPYIESLNPKHYLGIDMRPGPGVDKVVDIVTGIGTEDFLWYGEWDLVISTEMLEHVRDWRACMRQLSLTIAPGGLLVISTRSPGYDYHAEPEDHWRYTPADMQRILDILQLRTLLIEDDPSAPGVFVIAENPNGGWTPLDDIHVDGVDLLKTPSAIASYAAWLNRRATDLAVAQKEDTS